MAEKISRTEKSKQTRAQSMFPILLTVFIDMIGVGIVIPLFAPMFLSPSSPFFPASFSLADRTVLMGFLLAVYPLALFFGAPVFGALSDHSGRKKVLMISLTGTVLGYIIAGMGVINGHLALIFIGRAVSGFAGGNIATAMSVISDLSDKKSKAKNFGIIGSLFGLGMIIGPFIGGKLGDSNVVSWFNYATPFWFAACLAATNLLCVMLIFRETLPPEKRVRTKISPLTGFINIKKAFGTPNLRIIFIVSFLYTLGFNFYTQFFQVYLIEKFAFGPSQIGSWFAYIGVWIIITQGFIVGRVSKRFAPEKIVYVCMLCVPVSLLLLLIPQSPYGLFFIVPLFAIFQGLNWPNLLAIVSNLGDEKSQGEIIGINQSMQALAMAITSVMAGFVVSMYLNAPIIVASGIIFSAWLVFMIFFRGKSQKFSEI